MPEGHDGDVDRALVDTHEIDERDQLSRELFEHVQNLRTRGYTPAELAPRLRGLADDLEKCFGDSSSWNQAPVDKDPPVLPGDDDGE